jgi:hypothetical protein
MVSERQIAANRHNAQKSTGPKSQSGKNRSSKNAFRHGLSLPVSKLGSEAQFEYLSHQFAGDTSDTNILALAEKAADAQLDLARVRKAQTAMIERAVMLSASGARYHQPELEEFRHRITQNGWRQETLKVAVPQPEMLDSSKPLPEGNEEGERRFVDAVRPILSELIKLYRYEKRAATRRDRAISEIVLIKTAKKKCCNRSV